ncbi:hypothetical protein SSX86_014712 [Deinandra increscens subsp. villosa]|uniref:Uncharacterized protein n=1 Tax=Deinandra increscens subsp. villosa TaxID=3103831 RepID=A0AAP0D2R4_9ASTR
MEPTTILILLSTFSMFLQLGTSRPIIPHISVMGKVYCDPCYNNSFNTHHSYLLSGAEVSIDCKFQSATPGTVEQISFSVNRTTNRYGVYSLDVRVPSVDGIKCARDGAVFNTCRATLVRSGSSSCNVPGLAATSDRFSLESKRENGCIYSMFDLSFGPSKKDLAICGK